MNTFKFREDRDRYLCARFVLRTALSENHPDCRPNEWRIVRGKNGKPNLDPMVHPASFYFNISHAKDAVVCALCKNYEIGIDIEYKEEIPDMMEIAKHHFSSAEVEMIQAVSRSERLNMFYRIWTLKESYIKATGSGLQHDLKSFSFSLDKNGVVFRSLNDDKKWSFRCLDPFKDYIGALAVPASHDFEIRQIFRFDG